MSSQEPKGESGGDEAVVSIKQVLEDPEATVEQILEALDQAEKLDVSREMLSRTKIGLIMGKLKKHNDGTVADRSRTIVDSWKAAIGGTKREREGDNGEEGSNKRAREDDKLQSAPVAVDAKFAGPFVKEEKRNKARELLFRAFLEGMGDDQRDMLDVTNVSKLVSAIEEFLHDHHVDKNNDPRDYASQLRSIKANLSDKKNPEFNARIYLGAITAEHLAVMPSVEMASDAKKRERQKAKKVSH